MYSNAVIILPSRTHCRQWGIGALGRRPSSPDDVRMSHSATLQQHDVKRDATGREDRAGHRRQFDDTGRSLRPAESARDGCDFEQLAHWASCVSLPI